MSLLVSSFSLFSFISFSECCLSGQHSGFVLHLGPFLSVGRLPSFACSSNISEQEKDCEPVKSEQVDNSYTSATFKFLSC